MKRMKFNLKTHLLHDEVGPFHVLVRSSKFMWSSISVNVAKLKYFLNFFFNKGPPKLCKHQIVYNLSLALGTVRVYRFKISKATKS